jgi:two-component system sensor histidine kinase KdpD
VPLDEVQIDHVLSNLVENAAKYSPPGSEIALSVYRGDPDLVIEVADRGPGIPTEEIGQLFTPFHRVTRSGPRTSGFGVGLAVAKGLVEAHGGRIWAANRADGGARFVFTLPLANTPERRPAGTAAR